MITLEDCIAFCGLTEAEVLAIGEHEHLPEVAACALAEYLLKQEHGPESIRDMIIDDIRAAQVHSDRQRVQTLLHVLHHFQSSPRSPAARAPRPPFRAIGRLGDVALAAAALAHTATLLIVGGANQGMIELNRTRSSRCRAKSGWSWLRAPHTYSSMSEKDEDLLQVFGGTSDARQPLATNSYNSLHRDEWR